MDALTQQYGGRIRVRVMGLCYREDALLLVRQRVPGRDTFWLPPGGGLDFGERQEDALCREFREETGLEVRVSGFERVHEFIEPPLHAIELIYRVEITGGTLRRGYDPEYGPEEQLIQEVAFLSPTAIAAIPESQRHPILLGY